MKKKIIPIILTGMVLLTACGNSIEEYDTGIDPSGVIVNDEELCIDANNLYEDIMNTKFPDRRVAENSLFVTGSTAVGSNTEPIVLKPEILDDKKTKDVDESAGFVAGVYDFEKSFARRKAEDKYDFKYTGDIEKDVETLLSYYTTENTLALDEGWNNFSTDVTDVLAEVTGVKFETKKEKDDSGNKVEKKVLHVDFKTYSKDDSDPKTRKKSSGTESVYDESSAAYTFCENAIKYILLAPEYIDNIDTIEIKCEGFAAMTYSRKNIYCTYAISNGSLYQTWNGVLDQAILNGDTTIDILKKADISTSITYEQLDEMSETLYYDKDGNLVEESELQNSRLGDKSSEATSETSTEEAAPVEAVAEVSTEAPAEATTEASTAPVEKESVTTVDKTAWNLSPEAVKKIAEDYSLEYKEEESEDVSTDSIKAMAYTATSVDGNIAVGLVETPEGYKDYLASGDAGMSVKFGADVTDAEAYYGTMTPFFALMATDYNIGYINMESDEVTKELVDALNPLYGKMSGTNSVTGKEGYTYILMATKDNYILTVTTPVNDDATFDGIAAEFGITIDHDAIKPNTNTMSNNVGAETDASTSVSSEEITDSTDANKGGVGDIINN